MKNNTLNDKAYGPKSEMFFLLYFRLRTPVSGLRTPSIYEQRNTLPRGHNVDFNNLLN
jgi:hypothetical protein